MNDVVFTTMKFVTSTEVTCDFNFTCHFDRTK